MKFKKEYKEQYSEGIDLGFAVVPSGVYDWEIDEGIELFTNEESGKTSLKIPLLLHTVIEGDGEEGSQAVHFVPIESEFGERQLAAIITLVGLLEYFGKKYKGDVDPINDEIFLEDLALKLPGKIIRAKHEVRKNNKGREVMNFLKFMKATKGKKKPAKKKSQTEDKTPDTEEEEDW